MSVFNPALPHQQITRSNILFTVQAALLGLADRLSETSFLLYAEDFTPKDSPIGGVVLPYNSSQWSAWARWDPDWNTQQSAARFTTREAAVEWLVKKYVSASRRPELVKPLTIPHVCNGHEHHRPEAA